MQLDIAPTSNVQQTSILILESYKKSIHVQNEPPFFVEGLLWTADANLTVGGIFYDYIRSKNGINKGVCFWLNDNNSPSNNLVLQRFSKDNRFIFDEKIDCLYIIFDESDVDNFKSNCFVVECVQDFSSFVVTNDGKYGIVIPENSVITKSL
jgi:hypothetical protein